MAGSRAVGALVAFALSAIAAAHPGHITVGEAAYRADTARFEVALKVDAGHLEDVLTRREGRRVSLDRPDEIDSILAAYLTETLRLRDADDRAPWTLAWIGQEVVGLDAWLYLELIRPVGSDASAIEVRHRLMLDDRPRQVNTVTFVVGADRRSLHVTADTPEWQPIALSLDAARGDDVDAFRRQVHPIDRDRPEAILRVASTARLVVLGSTGDDAAANAAADVIADTLVRQAAFDVLALECGPLAAPDVAPPPGVTVVAGVDVPTLDAAFATRLLGLLDVIEPSPVPDAWRGSLDSAANPTHAAMWRDVAARLPAMIDEHRIALLATHGDATVDALERAANDVPLAIAMTPSRPAGGLVDRVLSGQREFAIAAHLDHLLRTRFADRRIIARLRTAQADRRLSPDGGVRTTMGNWLRQRLGASEHDRLVRALVFTNGRRVGAIERLFDRSGMGMRLLDLRSSDASVLTRPMTGSPFGWPHDGPRVWGGLIDAIVCVDGDG